VRGIYTSENYFARGKVLAHFETLREIDMADEGAATTVFVYFDQAKNLDSRRELLAERLNAKAFEVSFPKTDSEAISAISSASTRYEEDTEGRDRIMLVVATIDEVLGIVRTILAAIQGIGPL
jgi:hypothetical protein